MFAMNGRTNLIYMGFKVVAELVVLFLMDNSLSTSKLIDIFLANFFAVFISFGGLICLIQYVGKLQERLNDQTEQSRIILGHI